mmetsp:Transcript_66039/g.153406  ORF Transcript_66039/g.153406 Transcript_66039/m.153406 type:complete len:170 (-) Transcript_66039:67-576(-)
MARRSKMTELGFTVLVIGAVVRLGAAVHACDSEQGAACPSEAGTALGECLKDPSRHESKIEISEGCKAFMALNDACSKEIERSCSGMAYSDDTIVCLTQWTQASDLSEECSAALPKKEEEQDAAVDSEKEAWRQKRKAARKAATAMLEEEQGGTKKRRRRRSKKKSADL